MRRGLWLPGALCVLLACELQTREPSPASVPARVVTAPAVGSPIDPATGASSSTPSGPASPATPSGGSSAPSAGAVQCAGDGSCTVARRDFDAMVADPDKLARQVQVTPAGAGYRLSGIRAGSQVTQLGFRNGDVLLSVNGTRLDDQLGLLGLYAGLDSTRSYNVSYQRGGVKHSRTIRVRD